MSKPGQFLITLSGARSDILAYCPGERIKFQGLGWIILITAGMAVLSMWFALTTTLDVNAYAAVLLALLWGLVIMGIDRWLVTSVPSDRRRKFLMAIPRLVLAILLGTLISTPIVLRIFAPEIASQISLIHENNEAAFLTSQQHSSIAARVTKWQGAVNNLQQVITSHGAEAINPANDPVVQGLTTQLTAERKVEATDYKAWQCQLYGGCGAPVGNGPLARASQQRYDADQAQVSLLTSQIQAREKQLQANGAASQQTRLQQAQSTLPADRAQLIAAQAEETSLLDSFQSNNGDTHGLLIKLQALDQLSAEGGSLGAARWLLFLFFLVIEILPISVKLMQQPGLYEQVLQEKDRYQLREAKWRLRSGAGSTPDAGSPSGRVTELLPPEDRFAPRQSGGDVSTGELMRLFQRTETLAMPGHDRGEPARAPMVDVQDTTGPNRLVEELNDLPDERPGTNFAGVIGDFGARGDADDGNGERRTGIERVYRDDDL
jgi:hypothetical protein